MEGVGINHMASFTEQALPEPPKEVEVKTEAVEPVAEVKEEVKPEPAKAEAPAGTKAEEPKAEEPAYEGPKPIGAKVPEKEPEKVEAEKPAEPIVQETVQTQVPELTDEAVLEYFKKTKGKELSSLEDLFKEPEKQADPLEGLSEEALQFIKYNKETKRGFNDFVELNKDYTKLSSLEVARLNAISSSNGTLSQTNVDRYLEKKLGVDLSDLSNIDEFDVVELEGYGNPYRSKKMAEQEKYKAPIEVVNKPKADEGPQVEMVELEGGFVMPKAEYDKKVNQRNQYLDSVKKATDNITSSSYQVKVDNNGTEEILDLAYEYSKDDKHKMVLAATDIDNTITNLFGTENGIDHAKLQEGLWWADEVNRGKGINSLIHKALAEQAEKFMKIKNNPNFSTKAIPSKETTGGQFVIPGTQNNYGVKYNF